jgi:hypothetical protein
MEELERIHAIISSPVMIAGMPVSAAVVALAAVTLLVWLMVMVRTFPPHRFPLHFTGSLQVCPDQGSEDEAFPMMSSLASETA